MSKAIQNPNWMSLMLHLKDYEEVNGIMNYNVIGITCEPIRCAHWEYTNGFVRITMIQYDDTPIIRIIPITEVVKIQTFDTKLASNKPPKYELKIHEKPVYVAEPRKIVTVQVSEYNVTKNLLRYVELYEQGGTITTIPDHRILSVSCEKL